MKNPDEQLPIARVEEPRGRAADTGVSADEVGRRIKEALRRSAELHADEIRIDVHGSAVRLSGVVRSWQERGEVQRAAWSVPGVETVDDQLVVG